MNTQNNTTAEKKYTLDINENCDIHLGNLDEAKRGFNENSDCQIIGWEVADMTDFGDCWVKIWEKPDLDTNGCAEIDGIKCKVQNPGTHPGGNCYWLTPSDDVYIPIYSNIGS